MDDQTNQIEGRPSEAERVREPGVAALGRGGRMSRQRKTAAVLRLLRGEDLETVSRSLGVTAATLAGWQDAFLAGGEAALTTRAATGEEPGERAAEGQTRGGADRARPAEREDRALGGRPPFCPRQAQAMSRVISL